MKNNLSEIRKANKITQEQLAKKVGISKFHINRIEKEKHLPSILLSVRIAKVFGLRVEDIFFD